MGEKIELGSTVRDVVTGITGIVTARVEYLHAAPRLMVEYAAEGKASELWCEENRVEVVG